MRRVLLAASACAAVIAALPLVPTAAARDYTPPPDRLFAGVSDTGQTEDFHEFRRLVDDHPAVMQSFQVWGGRLGESVNRWRETRTRAMISISTSPCYMCPETISPRGIARGRGDGYIMRLSRRLRTWRKPTYIRLLPEMNGYWNPYSAFNADGTSRGRSHSPRQFRRAWKRFAIIIRGGRRGRINKRLRRLGMPRVQADVRRRLPQARVALMWVPQHTGSPNLRSNRHERYFPGKRFVDWAGADTYRKFANFAGLDSLYYTYRDLPFVIGEWSTWDIDDPAFVRALFEWAENRGRVRMLVYYQGFGEGNPFELQRYPDSKRRLRRRLDDPLFLSFASEYRR